MGKPKLDLSKLPMNIVRKNKYWFYDSKTGSRIHIDNIAKYLPKEEPKPVVNWMRNYDNY